MISQQNVCNQRWAQIQLGVCVILKIPARLLVRGSLALLTNWVFNNKMVRSKSSTRASSLHCSADTSIVC